MPQAMAEKLEALEKFMAKERLLMPRPAGNIARHCTKIVQWGHTTFSLTKSLTRRLRWLLGYLGRCRVVGFRGARFARTSCLALSAIVFGLPDPLVRECLEHTLDALKRCLPELAALKERLERELAEPATGELPGAP